MQTGVILLTSSPEQIKPLSARLQSKGIPVLDCTPEEVEDEAEAITDFIVENELEAVVVSNTSQVPTPASLRHSIEERGLSRNAVGWVDHIIQAQLLNDDLTAVTLAVVANLARLRHADHARDVVFRTVAGSAKISRRNLFRSIPRVLRVEADIPIVLLNRCANRSKTCKYCAVACPVNAISEAANGVTINDRLCTECGACARECPIGAIQNPSLSDSQLLAMLNTLASEEVEPSQRVLLLTCPLGFERILSEERQGKRLDSGTVPIEVPCVSSIGTVHRLWASYAGVTLVTVCPDSTCKKAVAIFPIYRQEADSTNTPESSGGDIKAPVRHLSLKPKDSIINSVRNNITSSTAAPYPPTLAEGHRREVTVDAIKKLGASGELDAQLFSGNMLPFFDLNVEGAQCTFCESCQTDCPDHAIEFTNSGDAVTLMFNPSLCGGCLICATNCPKKAITISRLTDLSAIVKQRKMAKTKDEIAKCENCGATLGSKRNLAALKKRLSEQRTADAALRALSLCARCKQEALIRPVAVRLKS